VEDLITQVGEAERRMSLYGKMEARKKGQCGKKAREEDSL
jgi:hypothetical protein